MKFLRSLKKLRPCRLFYAPKMQKEGIYGTIFYSFKCKQFIIIIKHDLHFLMTIYVIFHERFHEANIKMNMENVAIMTTIDALWDFAHFIMYDFKHTWKMCLEERRGLKDAFIGFRDFQFLKWEEAIGKATEDGYIR